MTSVQVVRSRLGDVSGLSALVGTRIYALKFPQNIAELGNGIRVTQLDRPALMHLRGVVGIYRASVQVDIVAKESSGGDPYANATAIWRLVHGQMSGGVATGLAGWSGFTSDSPSVDVKAILPKRGPFERYDSEELRMCVISEILDVWYAE